MSARLWLGLGLCVLVAFGGCGPQEESPPEASSLTPVPRPDLSGFAEAARRQLQAELAALDDSLADGGDRSGLADRYGRIGRIYHAYGLNDPALVAYRNAAQLAPDDFRWPYLTAVIDALRGDGAAAEAGLRDSLELEADHAAASLRLANLLMSKNRWAEAEPIFERLFERGVEPLAALHGLARAAADSGDHETAVERYERLIELAPDVGSLYYLLGLSYRQLGATAKAEEYLARRGPEQISFEDPLVDGLGDLVTGVGTPIERALTAYGSKDFAGAIEYYSEALAIDPDHSTALRGRALAYREAGDIARSSADFDRMLELYPDHQLVRLDYGTALLESGQLDRSIELLSAAVERDPGFKEAYFNLGVALTRAGRWRDAADAFEAVVQIDPRNVSARYHLGMSLDEAGDGRRALRALEETLEEAPGHVPSQQRLAIVREKVFGAESARETYRAITASEAAPPQERALAHFQIARLAKENNEVEIAIEEYRRALDLFPDLWQARFNLANTLAQEGRREEAAVELAGIVARDPKNVVARVRESELLRELGEFGIARARLEEGLEANPRSAELANAFARVLATAPSESVRDGARALEIAQGVFAAAPRPEHGQTLAMALAELGRFEEAVTVQGEAIDRLASSPERSSVRIEEARRVLDLFRAERPFRERPVGERGP